MKHFFYFLVFSIIFSSYAYSWDRFDRVIAVVNETPIIESELDRKFDLMLSKTKIPAKNLLNEKSRLLDSLIDQALIEQTAEKESIIVSSAKVDDRIQKIMQSMNIKKMDDFAKEIEEKEKVSFSEFKDELRQMLIRDQVMSFSIGVSPPSESDAREWYEKNKKDIGFEVNYQHIMIKMKDDSFSENKRANNIASDIYKKILNGESFGGLAKNFSEDAATKYNEGSMGWMLLQSLAASDITFANNIYKEFILDKKKYAVVKSSLAYHVVKFNEKRVTAFESVKDNILNLLYQKNLAEQFKKWAEQRKAESDIKIYMEGYVPEKA